MGVQVPPTAPNFMPEFTTEYSEMLQLPFLGEGVYLFNHGFHMSDLLCLYEVAEEPKKRPSGALNKLRNMFEAQVAWRGVG